MSARAGGPSSRNADVLAARRDRHRPPGCPGGQHVMRRDPVGPPDRPWRCIAEDCDAERAWRGGAEAWLAAHGRLPEASDEVPGQAVLELGLLALLRRP